MMPPVSSTLTIIVCGLVIGAAIYLIFANGGF